MALSSTQVYKLTSCIDSIELYLGYDLDLVELSPGVYLYTGGTLVVDGGTIVNGERYILEVLESQKLFEPLILTLDPTNFTSVDSCEVLINNKGSMTQEEKNTILLGLQCKHGHFGIKLAHALSIGKCSDYLLRKNMFIAFNIRMLRQYKAFESLVYNAVKLNFSKDYEGQEVTVNVDVAGVTIATYTGTEDTTYILEYLSNLINSTTLLHNYKATYYENTLYLYSYHISQSFATVVELVATDTVTFESITSSNESLENSLETLLNIWNCITLEEFNAISECLLTEYKIETLINLQ